MPEPNRMDSEQNRISAELYGALQKTLFQYGKNLVARDIVGILEALK